MGIKNSTSWQVVSKGGRLLQTFGESEELARNYMDACISRGQQPRLVRVKTTGKLMEHPKPAAPRLMHTTTPPRA